ncbi:hypothetical protein C5167_008378 [Papaver somniferum]|uniref:J domain-containing protein n=1 Tax=Papaver somniferum TaxID=3469 RepID=A0A4Y7JVF0_PAPSO|nr:hypothetical protein C5167_008378 [Papaver somniferum]
MINLQRTIYRPHIVISSFICCFKEQSKLLGINEKGFQLSSRRTIVRGFRASSNWSEEKSPYDTLVYNGSGTLEEGETTETRFIKIQAAYELLIDGERRTQYDREHRVNPITRGKKMINLQRTIYRPHIVISSFICGFREQSKLLGVSSSSQKPVDNYRSFSTISSNPFTSSKINEKGFQLSSRRTMVRGGTLEEGETAETRFIKIQAAYELLIDDERRTQYDREHRVNPMKASQAWMDWLVKKRTAFDQRGDMAVAAWAEQQQHELNVRVRRLSRTKVDPDEERRILAKEKKASMQNFSNTLKRHTLVLKKRDIMRKKAEDDKKKLITQLLAAEGLELATDDEDDAV